MTNLPTWLTIPTAGGSASINTAGLNMSTLYSPNDLVPAEHLNYFLNGFSNNGNVSETALANVISELVTILTAASITPNGGLTNQVKAALDALYPSISASQNANNLSTGTVPLARISGLTSTQVASGYKFSSSGGSLVSGTVTLPSIAIGEVRSVWMRTATTATIVLPASGTYSYFASFGTPAVWSTSHNSVQYDNAPAGDIIGGSTIASAGQYFVQYTRLT